MDGEAIAEAGPDVASGERTSRVTITHTVETQLWGLSAGRCSFCAAYLLDGRASHTHTTKVGELAHIVGATTGSKSPRGQRAMPLAARAEASNLVLLCHSCHKMVDDPANVEYWNEERITARKQEHEARVRRATDFSTLQRTLVVTTEGQVRGAAVKVLSRHVAHALAEAGLIVHVDGGHRADVLVRLPGDLTRSFVWDAARAAIDEGVLSLARWIEGGAESDISIFALAPIPMLVYLGACLDDVASVRVFDRHRDERDSDAWAWRPDRDSRTEFTIAVQQEGAVEDGIVVEVAVSGDARAGRLPPELHSLPRIRIEPTTGLPRPGLIETLADLESATQAWANLLAQVERQWPGRRTLHVIAAVPASLAIRIGQRRMRDVHPDLVVYQLVGQEYVSTPAITDPTRT